MSKRAFDKIAEGIKEAIQIARGERKPAKGQRMIDEPAPSSGIFSDEPVMPVYRRWLCENNCMGQLENVGSYSIDDQTWLHRCSVCGHEKRSTLGFPRIIYKPVLRETVDRRVYRDGSININNVEIEDTRKMS